MKGKGSDSRRKGDDIAERLLSFATRVVAVVQALPKSLAGRHIGTQLFRAGTSPGANYAEARGGESRADFVHKVGIAWKELKESVYWLQLIQRTSLLKPDTLDALIQEGNELCAILSKSRTTAQENARKQ